jgi:hypothetical protein
LFLQSLAPQTTISPPNINRHLLVLLLDTLLLLADIHTELGLDPFQIETTTPVNPDSRQSGNTPSMSVV